MPGGAPAQRIVDCLLTHMLAASPMWNSIAEGAIAVLRH
jgi:hypothetical protein